MREIIADLSCMVFLDDMSELPMPLGAWRRGNAANVHRAAND